MYASIELTRLLGIEQPVLQSPEPDAASVLAFSRSGGLGVLAAGPGLAGALTMLLRTGVSFAVQVDGALTPDAEAALRAAPVPVLIAAAETRVPAKVRLAMVDGVDAARCAMRSGVQAVIVPVRDGAIEAILAALPSLMVIAAGMAPGPGDQARSLPPGAHGLQLTRQAARVPDGHGPNESARPQRSAREAREAAALRENLARRKAHQRRIRQD